MSANAKRLTGSIRINYQVTEYRMAFLKMAITNMVRALELQPYPNEVINPGKGDFLTISFSEPKKVGTK